MTDSPKRVDLRDVEPLRPVDDDEPKIDSIDDVDRIGLASAAELASTPAVGVTAVRLNEEPPSSEDDDLEPLRRG
jgi:hypothetical protein